ncbi:hypothetical protein [Paenibacillus cremeus]|uniref:Uncharacterized protein n=1 Tax=Paenibacillus cremeus TaxID=2163881 RepID=A0A559KD57_9BACL|nr:hypothetical protein [Paenibacillus cremeus]TVY10076.1 hypothetical protein FPZ49_10150 [Paenibacillus cremeus]
MMTYGSSEVSELRFIHLQAEAELRDSQWMDVTLRFELAPGGELPEGIEELSALIICTHSGDIVQIVPQDEDRDCEYQFTELEKEQLRDYYTKTVRPRLSEYLI